MSRHSLPIRGVGAATPIGLSAVDTFGSIHTGISRRVESELLYDGAGEAVVVAEAPLDALPHLPAPIADRLPPEGRARRTLRLAARAYEDLRRSAGNWARPPEVCLLLPADADFAGLDDPSLAACVRGSEAPAPDERPWTILRGDRASVADVLERAAARLASGEAGAVIAGAADSWLEEDRVDDLDEARRLATAQNRDGFTPGEGAAFVALGEAPEGDEAPPVARIAAIARAEEPGHLGSDAPYRGEGLAAAFRAAIADAALRDPILEVWSSMNGESHWAKELGVAMVRTRAALDPAVVVHHTAEFHGDLGAASAFVAMVAIAVGRRLGLEGLPALVYGSSDGAGRAAIIIDRPEGAS